MIKVKVSVSWGKQELVHPNYNEFNERQVDAELKTIFFMVLPICATCKRDGDKIFVGRYLPNGQELLKC